MARDHRNLDAFRLADQLVLDVYRATASFPLTERFGLQSQVRRAAVSTPTNLVEGCARNSESDFLRFVDIAFGSSREVIYLISVARRRSFLGDDDARQLSELANRVAGALLNLRRAFRP